MVSGSDRRKDALLTLAAHLRQGGYRFVTPTPATHARVNARLGNDQAHDLAGVFGWSRPFTPGLLDPRIAELMEKAAILARDEAGQLRSTLRLSSLDDMLFWHSAHPTTGADAVFFGPDTYRFASAIAAMLPGLNGPVRRVADIGCGAGPGGILAGKAFPQADVLMIDINDAALALAQVNAELAGVQRARAVQSDLLSATEGDFDLIVSNPPYLNDPLVRAYRHGGGRHGEALSLKILDASLERLAPGGTLLLYTGVAILDGLDPFEEGARAKLRGESFVSAYREIDPDVFGEELEAAGYAGADRIAAVALTVTRMT